MPRRCPCPTPGSPQPHASRPAPDTSLGGDPVRCPCHHLLPAPPALTNNLPKHSKVGLPSPLSLIVWKSRENLGVTQKKSSGESYPKGMAGCASLAMS